MPGSAGPASGGGAERKRRKREAQKEAQRSQKQARVMARQPREQAEEEQYQQPPQQLVSAELAAQLKTNPLQGNDSTEYVTMPVSKKQKGEKPKDEWSVEVEEPVLSKTQAKKLKKLAERKEKEAKREEFLATLAKNAMGPNQLKLLQSSGRVGQTDTKKMKIRREQQRQKAGLKADQSLLDQKAAKMAARTQKREIATQATAESQQRAAAKLAFYPTQAKASVAPIGRQHTEYLPPATPEAEPARAEPVLAEAVAAADTGKYLAPGDAGPADADAASAEPKAPIWVPVKRSPAVQKARMELPVCAEEQKIMEAIAENDVVILVGETGSGKTTQLPQFLYEAGYGTTRQGMVGCTQPRRVAAYSMAKRVAHELNVGFGKVVSYQIRHENNVTRQTAVKFMTDGVLLREIEADFLLPQYSSILLDEAHERTLNTDLLLGLLPRIVKLRSDPEVMKGRTDGLGPLKLVIMSATFAATELAGNTRLFPGGPPPVVKVEARQHPVTVHFSRTTEIDDYVLDAIKKVAKIHRKLPKGGILVFLTGQHEVERMCTLLRKQFPNKRKDRPLPGSRDSDGATVMESETENKLSFDGAGGADSGDEGEPSSSFDTVDCPIDAEGGESSQSGAAPTKQILLADDPQSVLTTSAAAENSKSEKGKKKKKKKKKGRISIDVEEDDESVTDLAPHRMEMEVDPPAPKDFTSTSEYPSLVATTPVAVAEVEDATLFDLDSTDEDEGEVDEYDELPENRSRDRRRDKRAEQKRTGKLPSAARAGADADGAEEDTPSEQEQQRVYVLPMYSMLPSEAQQRVFKPPPEGSRLIVVATNVAETSITIPGIRYVIDAGRAKQKLYKADTDAVFSYSVQWISQASAKQRAGRAGRTGPGHCYRLFSSAVFENHFTEWSEPEIVRMPLDSVCLRLKCLGIKNLQTFPFPTMPPPEALTQAVKLLQVLGLLDEDGRRTALGQEVANVPASPRLGLMLVLGRQTDVLAHAAVLTAALSVGDPFLQQTPGVSKTASKDNQDGSNSDESDVEEAQEEAPGSNPGHGVFAHPRSDILAILMAVGAYEYEKYNARQEFQDSDQSSTSGRAGGRRAVSESEKAAAAAGQEFAVRHNLSNKLMSEISSLQTQLRSDSIVTGGRHVSEILIDPPTTKQEIALRQLITAAYIDRVARLMPLPPGTAFHSTRGAAYLTARPTDSAPGGVQPASSEEGGPPKPRVWLHRGSALHSSRTDSAPEWVIYHEVTEVGISRGRRGLGLTERRVLKLVTEIDSHWLAGFARNSIALCRLSAPLPAPAAHYLANRDQVMCYVRPTFGFGAVGWSLPPHLTPVLADSTPASDRATPQVHEANQAGLFHSEDAAASLAFCVFARAILEGSVLPALAPLQPYWVARPELITRPNSLGDRKIQLLVDALRGAGVCSRRALVEQLRLQPSFLLQAVKQWVVMPKRHLLDRIWPLILGAPRKSTS